jgi:hypothetical protein
MSDALRIAGTLERIAKKKETNLIENIATGGKNGSYPLNERTYNRTNK